MLLRRTALHLGVAEGPVDTATAPGIVSSIHSHSSTQLKSSKRYLGMFSALYSALRTSLHTTEPTHPTQFSSSMPEKMKEKIRRSSKAQRPRPAGLPVDLYRPIVLQVAASPNSKRDLMNLLVVSKSMAREVQMVLYHSLLLTPNVPQPYEMSDDVGRMVRQVQIKLGNRFRAANHTMWCIALLPRLTRLNSIEIKGRDWDPTVFEACLPRGHHHKGEEYTYEGITSITNFQYEGVLNLSVMQFLAHQPNLRQLEITNTVATSVHTSDALQIFKDPFMNLIKVNVPHAYAKIIVQIAPCLKHLSLSFDAGTTSNDLVKTFSSLPATLESLVLQTTRRDLLPAHASLPKSLRRLSTVLVANESDKLIEYLGALKRLEHVVLNVCQPVVPSFINPFATSPPSPAPNGSNGSNTINSNSGFGGGAGGGFGVWGQSLPSQALDEDSLARIISTLKKACPSIKLVEVDDQVYQRRGSTWAEDPNNGGFARRETYDIRQHRESSVANLWRMSI